MAISPPGIHEPHAHQHEQIAVKGRSEAMVSPGLDILGTETAAIHIQTHADAIGQDGHEKHQQSGDRAQGAPQVDQQGKAGQHFQGRQDHGQGHEHRIGDQTIGFDKNGKDTRGEKLLAPE